MNDFEKMSMMSRKNQDIRMTADIISADKIKQGGKITIGVDANTFNLIISQLFTGKATHYVALYVINKEQFDALKDLPYEPTPPLEEKQDTGTDTHG